MSLTLVLYLEICRIVVSFDRRFFNSLAFIAFGKIMPDFSVIRSLSKN